MENTQAKKADFYDCYHDYVREMFNVAKDYYKEFKEFDGGANIAINFLIQGIEMVKTELNFEYSRLTFAEEIDSGIDLEEEEEEEETDPNTFYIEI
jgi:hypothetical protein